MYTGKKVTTFQKRFSDLVEGSDKTITAIAKDLHVSNQTISAWKIGTRSPKAPTIIVIANYFGVSVEWIMGFDVDRNHKQKDYNIELKERVDQLQTIEARILATGIDSMPKEQREQALTIMKTIFVQYADHFDNKEKKDET